MQDYIIEMKNIQKSFAEVQAIKNGQFNLRCGEIHSLIGENGAGKSTLMKILFGMIQADSGEIIIRGEQKSSLQPKEAIRLGIGMVHQEFMLIQNLTVLENMILGFEPRKGRRIDFDMARKKARLYIEQYGLQAQLDKKISEISLAEAQRVEIIKTLMRGAEIIILDEPTAVLTPQETEGLFRILNKLKEDKKSIVFISHKLNEVMEISDRVTVMRQGNFIGTVQKNETNQKELARMMIGREVFLDIERRKQEIGMLVFSVQDLWVPGDKESSKIKGVSFGLHSGEIVGIAGIDGNGQSELTEAICGLRKIEKGTVMLGNEEITHASPLEIREKGISHIPEDRNTRGLNRYASVEDNLVATVLRETPFSKKGLVNRSAIHDYAKKLIEKFDIRPPLTQAPASSMSGGNAQKVVVARALSDAKKILIASQPTRGVDIGAIESIRSLIEEATRTGIGVLLISADLQEILSLSDRILVMYEGEIVGEMTAAEANEEHLGLLMMGVKEAANA